MKQYASSSRKDKNEFERSQERDYKEMQMKRVALLVWPAYQSHRYPGKTSVRGLIVA